MILVTNSSNVGGYLYDSDSESLLIGFSDDPTYYARVYTYENVPQSVFDGLVDAVSKGEFVCEHIAFAFSYTYHGYLEPTEGTIDYSALHAIETVLSQVEPD